MGRTKNARDKALNKTKQNKNKKKIKISWCSDHTLEGGGEGVR